MRAALRSGGDLILPKFRARRTEQPPLVVLADISGSMSQYTRIFLHFLHALSETRRAHAFLFGTREAFRHSLETGGNSGDFLWPRGRKRGRGVAAGDGGGCFGQLA